MRSVVGVVYLSINEVLDEGFQGRRLQSEEFFVCVAQALVFVHAQGFDNQ